MLKGNTKIELTNIHTGKKEVIEKHNTFTEALPKLMEYFHWTGTTFYGNHSSHAFLPLSTVGLSGIYLMAQSLSENVTQVSDFKNIVGYAGFSVDTSGSKYIGSLNKTESKKLDNGYQYVWDFGTDRANGVISTVGLTNGSFTAKNNTYFPYEMFSDRTGEYLRVDNLPWLGQCVDCTEFGQKFMFAVLTTTTTIKFTQIQITHGIVKLNYLPLSKIIKEKEITIPDISIVLREDSYSYSTCCYISFDVKNKFYYLITPTKYVRINANTLEYDSAFGVKNMPSIFNNVSINIGNIFAGVINGYMYRYGTGYELYKWEVGSPESAAKLKKLNDYYNLNSVGSYFIGRDKVLDPENLESYDINNGKNKNSSDYAGMWPVSSSDNTNVYLSAYSNEVGYCNMVNFIGYRYAMKYNYKLSFGTKFYPYFATINNLDEPVTKTSDKTMKITYTVTEE